MADMERPFEAYRGEAPFVFVSYAHADAATVFPDLIALRDAGFNVYYDEGISPGSRWTTELAEAIDRCAVFVAFLSPDAVASENCTNEIEFAVSRRRPMLVVHTRATTLPPGLELSLGGRQALMRSELPADTYRNRLIEAVTALTTGGDPAIPRAPTERHRRPMLLAATVVVAAGLAYLAALFAPQGDATELRAAIAVRPFDTSSAEKDTRFFANGIADDLIIRLGSWRTLPVIARGSSFTANLPADPADLGRALDARYIVEGSVSNPNDQLEISVYLVDAERGSSIWSQVFTQRQDAALATQAAIADAIVAQINPALISAETRRAARADPANLDAWSAAMRGWWYLNTETRDGLEEALVWFQRAIELDPTWSWAHAALALSRYRASLNGWTDDAQANAKMMIQAANQAVQLDARDAFAHHALGHAYAMQGQIDQALKALARGVELTPNDAMANGCYAMQLAASARSTEALTVIDHATDISPDDPWLHRFALVRARAYFAAGDYPSAEEWALRSQQLKPNMGATLHSIAAPALGDGLERATQRTSELRNQRPLPPLAMVERGFSRSTDPGYLSRLLEGLRRAGFQ
jgi:TolB-like protein